MTARVESEAALRESEQRYRIFFDNAAFGAVELDLEGKTLRVNKRACEMGGYTAEEFVGKKVMDEAHPDDIAGYLEARASYLKESPKLLPTKCVFIARTAASDGSGLPRRWFAMTAASPSTPAESSKR